MGNRIYRKLLELVRIPSITESEAEIEITRFLYDNLAKEQYFREHPEHLNLIPGPDGKRHSLVAMVRSASETAETVLCISHLDVVDVDVYGDLAKEAFDPEALQPLLKNYPLDEAAQKDLESGNWIFGRGVMDMKCGVALELDLLEELARNRNSFDVNIVVAAVFDEEGSNQGMISVVHSWKNWLNVKNYNTSLLLTLSQPMLGCQEHWNLDIFSAPWVRLLLWCMS